MISNGVEYFSKIDYKYGVRPAELEEKPGKLKKTLFLLIPPILLKGYYYTKTSLLGLK
jgi:hypothetical protein